MPIIVPSGRKKCCEVTVETLRTRGFSARSTPQEGIRFAYGGTGMTTILVIDDEPGVRDLLEDALTGAGYRVETATNGAEGSTSCDGAAPICAWWTSTCPP